MLDEKVSKDAKAQKNNAMIQILCLHVLTQACIVPLGTVRLLTKPEIETMNCVSVIHWLLLAGIC